METKSCSNSGSGAEHEELVAGLAKRLQAAGFKNSTKVEDGDARELILEYAKKWHPDLILLGSHGRRGLDRFLLGSVSEAVARPVLSRDRACSGFGILIVRSLPFEPNYHGVPSGWRDVGHER